MTRHNKLHDWVDNISGKSFTPLYMCNDPLINTGRAMKEGKEQTTGSPPNYTPASKETSDQKGYLLIRDLWQRGTNSIRNMHVVNNDALSHQNKSLEKCLQTSEKEEERNYLEACLPQRRHFYPFLISVDSLLGLDEENPWLVFGWCFKIFLWKSNIKILNI